jgi:hypothetical protein
MEEIMTIGLIDGGFRGFAGDPQSELEVAYLLGLAQPYLPFPFVVTAINDAFPDCEGLDPTTGKRVAVELEVRSRNFLSHGHALKGCGYIVCWEDNWKDAPASVRRRIVALKGRFRTEADLARKFIYRPRPDSLRAQLAEIQVTNPKAHAAVSHLLDVALPQLQLHTPAITLDETGTKHFSIKYGSGKGMLGVYPAGKLVAGAVHDTVARYGEPLRVPTRKLREAVKKIGVLRSEKQCPALVEALAEVMQAIARRRLVSPRGGARRGEVRAR